ncbi:MAG: hypothetical protein FWG73_01430 [Planctomycetaceae bacterium]|nr:hypothetical protein [Planctomycetaceae bacterium]
MKRKHIFILVTIIVVNIIVFVVLTNWRAQQQEQARIMLRDATRYTGVEGPTITAFDERTQRFIAELRDESIEETLRKLTGASEYVAGFALSLVSGYSMSNEEGRERLYYHRDVKVILSNRRFRKAYEDIQNMNKRQAAELLTQNIRENLVALRTMLQEDRDKVARGEHTGVILIPLSSDVEDAYRPMSRFDEPPTRTGRRYAVFSYLLLASSFEIREVRPAIEEVIQFAKEEYEFFNSFDYNDHDTFSFKAGILGQSLYNPSLLLTATLCDLTWNLDRHRSLEAKLVTREVVDYQARAIEHDRDARMGLHSVVPHDRMLIIRFYRGIMDEEFNAFFQ